MNDCNAERMCDFLLDRCGEGKGFKALHTLNIDEGRGKSDERFLGVVYKKSASDKGLLINCCPWCGGKPGYFKRT